MLVYVMSSTQLHQAQESWCLDAATDSEAHQRQALVRIFDEFSRSREASNLQAPTGLYCFTLEQLEDAFTRWIQHQIRLQPDKRTQILEWQTLFLEQWRCWGIPYKLVVRECLCDEDLPVSRTRAA